MRKQIRQLTAVQLINLFGWNEVRYTKDKKKKARYAGLAFAWLLVVAMLVVYVGILAAAYVKMGMGEVIPMYLFMVSSLVILCFTFFKAGSVIFQMNTCEMLMSLPVSQTAIVVSRFLSMYMTNLLLAALVMLPGVIIYGVLDTPTLGLFVYSILGTLILPLLPMTIATGIGAGITAISSRMRHKNQMSAFLNIMLVVGILVASMVFSGNTEQLTEEMMRNMAQIMTEQITKIYPPAAWFGEAAVQGKVSGFLLLAGVSILLFVVLVAVLQKYFMPICMALNATSAKNNYKMQSLAASSPLKALWKREFKRYFSSSIYVTNTLVGYILMLLAGIGIFVAGAEKVDEIMQMPGLTGKTMPLLLAAAAVIMPTTSCSVSMEGKQWWIAQTLPVKSSDIWNSKILLNLTLAFPFYLVSVILGILAVKPTFLEGFWIVVIPFVYILFTAVAGITINLAFPVMEWENETRVVKQSASTIAAMLAGMACIALPMVGVFALREVSVHLIYLATALVLLCATAILAGRNNKKTVIF